MTTEPEYDAATCITAGELREAGMVIETDIPDCAWIPHISITYGRTLAASHDAASGTIILSLVMHVSEPFRWVQVAVTTAPAEEPRLS